MPFGNCLVVETILIPIAMVVVDGFLLAWLLAELRNAGLDVAGEGRLDPLQAVALMPAAALACVAALPARYVADLRRPGQSTTCPRPSRTRPSAATSAGSSATGG